MVRRANEGVTNFEIAEATIAFEKSISDYKVGPVFLLEMEFPSGTKYYSDAGARFVERFYKGKIQGIGSLRRAMQQNLGLFETSSIECRLADEDQELINLVASTKVKDVLARFKIGTREIELGSYETIFEGKIDDFGAENYAFRILVRDKLWSIPEYPNTGKINTTDFPYAYPPTLGMPLPVCYGSHSFNSTDDPAYPNTSDAKLRGAFPTLYVDVRSTERTFLIASHAVKAINEVYAYKPSAGSQLLTLTTDYTAYPAGTLAGETMAYIKLTTTGFNKLIDSNALGILTVNVDGKEDVGDGSGTLLENPVDVMQDFLANYLGNPEINTDKFATANAIADSRVYQVVGGYTEEKTSADVIKDICDSFQIRIFPDKNGKVAISIFEPVPPGDVDNKLRTQWEILKDSWRLDFSSDVQGAQDSQVINYVEFSGYYHWANKSFRISGTRSDTDSISEYGEKKLTLKLPWNKSSTSSSEVCFRIVTLYKQPVATLSCDMPLGGAELELTDLIAVTHPDGPENGYDGDLFEITEITIDPSSLRVSLKAKDVTAISGNAMFLGDETAWELL